VDAGSNQLVFISDVNLMLLPVGTARRFCRRNREVLINSYLARAGWSGYAGRERGATSMVVVEVWRCRGCSGVARSDREKGKVGPGAVG